MTVQQKRREFEREYHDLFAYVYRYLSFRIPHVQDCEDVTAAVFMEAYDRIDRYDPKSGSLKQWLIGILRHKLADYWRKQRIVLDVDAIVDQMSHDIRETSDRQIDEAEWFARVMDSLPDDVRSLFTMRYVDDMTYAEIARCTNKNPATIRKLFSDTHKQITQTIQHAQL